MTWHHLSANWHAIREQLITRFPNIDPDHVTDAPRDRQALTRHIAETHDITVFEAHEELQDFLSVLDLARQVLDAERR